MFLDASARNRTFIFGHLDNRPSKFKETELCKQQPQKDHYRSNVDINAVMTGWAVQFFFNDTAAVRRQTLFHSLAGKGQTLIQQIDEADRSMTMRAFHITCKYLWSPSFLCKPSTIDIDLLFCLPSMTKRRPHVNIIVNSTCCTGFNFQFPGGCYC